MDVIREGGSETLKKKKHKRKYGESKVVRGEDVSVEVADPGHRNKSKTEGLADVRVSETALDVVSNVSRDGRSKKEKKKKLKGEVSGAEEHVRVEGEVKKKKKKNKEVLKINEDGFYGIDGTAKLDGFVEKDVVRCFSETAEAVEKKKRKKEKQNHGVTKEVERTIGKKHKKEKNVDDVTVKDVVHSVSETAEAVENKKRKKEKQNHGVSKEVERTVGKKHKKEKNVDDVTVNDNKRKKKEKEQNTAALVNDEEVHKDYIEVRRSVKDKKNKKRKKDSEASICDEEERNRDGKINKSVTSFSVKEAKERDNSANPIENSYPRKESRRVKFADSVEIFPLPNNSDQARDESFVDGNISSEGKDVRDSSEGEEGLAIGDCSDEEDESLVHGRDPKIIQGKRFTKDEDEQIMSAIKEYVEENNLGEEGFDMVMKCSKNRKKVAGCWDEIAKALPWRTKNAIYCRAHILYERGERRTWTKEELEMVRDYYEKHGPKWRELADELGRNRIHVKDAYRQVKLPNNRKGPWSPEEYQTLFDLVNKDIRMKVFMDKKSQHGMLRDNIGWQAISSALSTRTDPICCMKWYDQLTSPMVVQGQWADSDDYRMLVALVELDATCEEDVDWDSLVENRSGDVCRKRFNEMVRHISQRWSKSFPEEVEILSRRYCEDVLEARVIYENKPVVD